MSRKTLPVKTEDIMSNFVFVIDECKKPLPPIHPGLARRLLKQQKAAVFRSQPFTIILKDSSPLEVGNYNLKLDPGSKVTGVAIVNDDKVIWAAEIAHRGEQIKSALDTRRQVRRSRRNRKTRYRKARFLNRKRRKVWLPPSILSRIENIVTWVKRIIRYVPITGISQELVKFDAQALQNPEISGKEYQQGELFGYEVREYLLQKWKHQCAYCGESDTRLEVEHIHALSKGGSNRVSNLAIACHDCNQKKSNQDIVVFLKNKKTVLNRILAQAKSSLKDAAAVNSTRYELLNRLKSFNLPVETGTGGRTKFNRRRLDLPKKHWIDAAAVGEVDKLVLLTKQPLLIRATGWGSRQMCITNKFGFPIRHKTRSKVHFGYQTGDVVKAALPKGKFTGTHVGRISVRKIGKFDLRRGDGLKVSPVNHKYCKAIHRNDGYSYNF